MANSVFANGREVSCKAGAGKTIASFPDVCMTPPQTPATPPGVPIPYPNNGLSSDTTGGTKSVKISGEEVGQKDKYCFNRCSGDEAGCAPKKGVKSSKNSGKVYFTSWSPDVKFEGENAVRHLDTTTDNHGSNANEAIPWVHIDTGTFATHEDCKTDREKEKTACQDYKPNKPDGLDVCEEAGLSSKFSKAKGVATKRSRSARQNPCAAARKCRLLPYNGDPRDGINGCCPAQTGDHIIPKSSFFKDNFGGNSMTGWSKYNKDKAPCMCLEGGSCSGSHGLRHAHHKASRTPAADPQDHVSFDSEAKHCSEGAAAVSGCEAKCIEAQLKGGHKGMGDQSKPVKYSPTGKNYEDVNAKIQEMLPFPPGGAP